MKRVNASAPHCCCRPGAQHIYDQSGELCMKAEEEEEARALHVYGMNEFFFNTLL